MAWQRNREEDEGELDTRPQDVGKVLIEETMRRWRVQTRARHFCPPTDVYETDDAIVVTVEIAGLQEDDFQISLSNRALTVSGVRCDPAEKLAYQQMEIEYGHFMTQVHLPWSVEAEGIEAVYDRGFLKISLDKSRAKRIPIAVRKPSQTN